MTLFWAEHTHEDIKAAASEDCVIILPVGACEQHGPHLPVDTDIFQATEKAAEGAKYAAEKYGIKVLVLPTIPYGDSSHHAGFHGTIFISPELLMKTIYEILLRVAGQGFGKLVIVSGHGGNRYAIRLAANEARRHFIETGLRAEVFFFEARYQERTRQARKEAGAAGAPDHAGGCETSFCLGKRPHLVRRERIRPPKLSKKNCESPIYPTRCWATHEMTDTGSFGDPTGGAGATEEAGRKFWEALAEDVGEFLKQVADYVPDAPEA